MESDVAPYDRGSSFNFPQFRSPFPCIVEYDTIHDKPHSKTHLVPPSGTVGRDSTAVPEKYRILKGIPGLRSLTVIMDLLPECGIPGVFEDELRFRDLSQFSKVLLLIGKWAKCD